jgi:hypothetical protein
MLAWAAGLAAAVLLAAVAPWFWPHRPETVGPPELFSAVLVPLAAGWRIEPTGAADYQVVKPDLVQLRRGELLVESCPLGAGQPNRPALRIETPAGTARATGTKFYIGTHLLTPQLAESKGSTMTSLTRVLVLAGVVTLINGQGSVVGQANHLLAAETGQAPASYAVQANSDFALDLYQQLSKENPDKNLFFSPYSISSALAMAAEGARRQTALEMGTVLRLPPAARRIGEDAQLIPWNTALLHAGMAELNERLEKSQKPVPKEIADKIAELRKKIQASDAHIKAYLDHPHGGD